MSVSGLSPDPSMIVPKLPPEPIPGYFSTTSFDYEEGSIDAIIRVASYYRKDFGRSVIWFPAREHVNSGLLDHSSHAPQRSLGDLEKLPAELLSWVILQLDISSLFRFRQLNRRSRQVVGFLPEYQAIALHSPNVFCALVRTQLGRDVALWEFHAILCTERCCSCATFGTFVFLPTLQRYCFRCVRESLATEMLPLTTIKKYLSLPQRLCSRLRWFKTLSGIYTMEESPYRRRFTIACKQHAFSVGDGKIPIEILPTYEKFTFMSTCELPYLDRQSGTLDCGVSCAGCQLAVEELVVPNRSAPWLHEARDRVFSRAEFLQHFQWCQQAQSLWLSSADGHLEPAQLPYGAKRGGYFNERD